MKYSKICKEFKNFKERLSSELDSKNAFFTLFSGFVKDLGADSLDMAEIVMAIEEKFNIEIPDEESEKIKTVEDMVKTIEERIRMK